MNTSTLMQLLRENPKLADDIPSWLKRLNERNIERVVKTRVETVEATVFESFADANGGEATERDVLDALALLAAEPLLAEAKERSEKVEAAIRSGEVITSEDLKAAYLTSSDTVELSVVAVAEAVKP